MANEDFDESRIQSLRDKTVSALSDIQRSLENFNAKMKASSTIGGGLHMMENSVGNITKGLLGTAGLAAGLYQVGRALENVAQSSVAMNMMATNTGFATTQIKDMQQTLRRMGMDSREAEGIIQSLGSKLQNLGAFKEGSDFFKAMSQSEGGAALANQMQNLVRAGDQMGAVTTFLRRFNEQSRETKVAMSQYIGVPLAVLENMTEASKRNIQQMSINSEEAKRYLNMWVDFEVRFEGIWKKIAGHGIEGVNSLTEYMRSQGLSSKSIADMLNEDTDKTLDKIKATIQEIRSITDIVNTFRNGEFTEGGRKIGQFLGLPGNAHDHPQPPKPWPQGGDAMGEHDKGSTFPGRVDGWLNRRSGIFSPDTLRSWNANPRGITDFGGMRRREDLENEGNRTLIEIRDILERMENKNGGGTKFGEDYGVGSRSDGAMNAGRGGFRPGENPNGAAARMRDALGGSRAGGSDGMDPGAPGAPPMGIGPNDPNSPGARYLAERRAAFRKELDENPRTRELLGALTSAENPGAGPAVIESLMNRTMLVNEDRAKRGLPPLTLHDMMVGHPSIGGGKSFYGPMRTGAVNAHLNKMRTNPAFAARMYELQRQALSGSNTIRGHTDQGSAGDPNYHSGGVGVNINRERFNDWGYRGSRQFRERLQREYDDANGNERYKNPTNLQDDESARAARQRMDSKSSAGAFGKLNGEIRFLNVPPNVQTNMTQEGDIFQELKITKHKQGGGTAYNGDGDTSFGY